jgi:heme/copper-type cytochrome/quinol oxidase subunit 2
VPHGRCDSLEILLIFPDQDVTRVPNKAALTALARNALLLNVILIVVVVMVVMIVTVVLGWKWHGCDRSDGRRGDMVVVLSSTLAVIR